MSIDFTLEAPAGEAIRLADVRPILKSKAGLSSNGPSGYSFHGMDLDLASAPEQKGTPVTFNRIRFHLHTSQSEKQRERCLKLIDWFESELGWKLLGPGDA